MHFTLALALFAPAMALASSIPRALSDCDAPCKALNAATVACDFNVSCLCSSDTAQKEVACATCDAQNMGPGAAATYQQVLDVYKQTCKSGGIDVGSLTVGGGSGAAPASQTSAAAASSQDSAPAASATNSAQSGGANTGSGGANTGSSPAATTTPKPNAGVASYHVSAYLGGVVAAVYFVVA